LFLPDREHVAEIDRLATGSDLLDEVTVPAAERSFRHADQLGRSFDGDFATLLQFAKRAAE
jgi:hypothetical protein